MEILIVTALCVVGVFIIYELLYKEPENNILPWEDDVANVEVLESELRNMTKTDLVDYAEMKDIYVARSWKKDKLVAEILAGLDNL